MDAIHNDRHDAQDTRSTVMVLGARLGGSHIIKTLHAAGIEIRAVYDQDASSSGLALALEWGIPVYAGSFGEIDKVFEICASDSGRTYHVFLPSRDPKFVSFVARTEARWRKKGATNVKIYRMGIDFADYSATFDLLALMR